MPDLDLERVMFNKKTQLQEFMKMYTAMGMIDHGPRDAVTPKHASQRSFHKAGASRPALSSKNSTEHANFDSRKLQLP